MNANAGYRRVRYLVALLVSMGCARGQDLVFTTRTSPLCPVQMSGIVKSSEVGYASTMFRSDSRKKIDTLRVIVSFSSGAGEEVMERAEFLVSLAPGESKRVELGLGRVRELTAKAKALRKPAWAVLFVDSATFTDGSQWHASDPVNYDPVKAIK